MTEFLYVAIFFILLALLLLLRVYKGPSAADRAVAAEAMDSLVVGALVLFALLSGRSIYVDIAIVLALLGFISLVLIARHLEGSL